MCEKGRVRSGDDGRDGRGGNEDGDDFRGEEHDGLGVVKAKRVALKSGRVVSKGQAAQSPSALAVSYSGELLTGRLLKLKKKRFTPCSHTTG